jgi:hypothetical protein
VVGVPFGYATAQHAQYSAGGAHPLEWGLVKTGLLQPVSTRLSIDAASGELTVSPGIAQGVYPFTVYARQENKAVKTFDAKLVVGTPPALSGPAALEVEAGSALTAEYTVTGSPAPALTLSDDLEGLLSITDEGVLSLGEGLAAGQYGFTITAKNIAGESELAVVLTAKSAPGDITGEMLITAPAGTEAVYNYASEGYPAPAWSLINAPEGVAIDDAGVLTVPGTIAEGAYAFQVIATNNVGFKAAEVTLAVTAPGSNPVGPGALDGVITTLSSAGLSVDITGASTAEGAAAILWASHGGANQRFAFDKLAQDPDAYTIRNIASGLVLGIKGSAAQGAAIAQYTADASEAQSWVPVAQPDGTYMIASKADTSLYLGAAASGADVTLVLGTSARAFTLSPATDAYAKASATLASAAGDVVLDVKGASAQPGAQLIVWQATSGANQAFTLEYDAASGYYRILTQSGMVLDIQGASAADGAQVIQWPKHPSGLGANQLWYIQDAGNGGVYIRSAMNGNALDIKGGSTAAGTDVISWAYHGGVNQLWKIG